MSRHSLGFACSGSVAVFRHQIKQWRHLVTWVVSRLSLGWYPGCPLGGIQAVPWVVSRLSLGSYPVCPGCPLGRIQSVPWVLPCCCHSWHQGCVTAINYINQSNLRCRFHVLFLSWVLLLSGHTFMLHKICPACRTNILYMVTVCLR